MDHAYARELDPDRLARVLSDAGLGDGALDGLVRLGGGTYNTVYRLPRREGGGLVVKVSPRSTAPLLTYEHGILGTEALFDRLAARGYRMALAGIALPNDASVGLHTAMGFEPVGTYRRVGWKLGRWHDVTWFQRPLGSGPGDDGEPPAPPR